MLHKDPKFEYRLYLTIKDKTIIIFTPIVSYSYSRTARISLAQGDSFL